MTFNDIVNEIKRLNPGVEILIGDPKRDRKAYYRIFASVPKEKLKLPNGVKCYNGDNVQYKEDDFVITIEMFEKEKTKDGIKYSFCVDGGKDIKGRRLFYSVSVLNIENPVLEVNAFIEGEEKSFNCFKLCIENEKLLLNYNGIETGSLEKHLSKISKRMQYTKDESYYYSEYEECESRTYYSQTVWQYNNELKVLDVEKMDIVSREIIDSGRYSYTEGLENFLTEHPEGIECFNLFRNFINQLIPFEQLVVTRELIDNNGLSMFFDEGNKTKTGDGSKRAMIKK